MTRRLIMLLTIAGVLALPAAASADTTLTLNGPAAKSLRSKGVKIYEQLPARKIGPTIEFPVAGGAFGDTATIEHSGALRFKRGKRRLTLTSVQVKIGPGKQSLTAVHGGKRITIFWIRNGASKAKIGASTATLSGAKLRFTASASMLLRKKLGKGPSTKRNAGTIKVNASVTPEPAGFVRPATAVDITSATITWHVKDSFIQYIASGEGTTASGGATPGAPAGDGLVYDFTFPGRPGGWYDPVSHTADVLGQGTVRFKYSGHGIDISTSDPEIKLNGGVSRGIYRFQDGKRGVLYNLAATNPGATPFASGNIPGFVPAGAGGSVFAGFYAPGDEFGYVSVSFAT